jgi:uncharacterized protein
MMTNALDDAISLTKIDSRTRYFFALGALALLLLPLIPLWILIAKLKTGWWFLPVYFAAITALAYRYGKAAHVGFGFCLLDDGLWLQSGVYWRKAIFVPRERVQHTEVNHGPLDRKMGLAKLVVHTAGIRTAQLTIPGLTEATAHQLRDALLRREAPLAIDAAIESAPTDTAIKSRDCEERSDAAVLASPLRTLHCVLDGELGCDDDLKGNHAPPPEDSISVSPDRRDSISMPPDRRDSTNTTKVR